MYIPINDPFRDILFTMLKISGRNLGRGQTIWA